MPGRPASGMTSTMPETPVRSERLQFAQSRLRACPMLRARKGRPSAGNAAGARLARRQLPALTYITSWSASDAATEMLPLLCARFNNSGSACRGNWGWIAVHLLPCECDARATCSETNPLPAPPQKKEKKNDIFAAAQSYGLSWLIPRWASMP